jgi:hypothetical protein
VPEFAHVSRFRAIFLPERKRGTIFWTIWTVSKSQVKSSSLLASVVARRSSLVARRSSQITHKRFDLVLRPTHTHTHKSFPYQAESKACPSRAKRIKPRSSSWAAERRIAAWDGTTPNKCCGVTFPPPV